MANVWKVGSRWSLNGAPETSIISVFRRNNVVFVGNTDRISSVEAGDYLAIADGRNIVSIAKAIKKAEKIKNMNIKWSIKDDEKEILDGFEEYAIGVKVQIVDLKSEDRQDYAGPGSICEIRQDDLRKKIIAKFENQGKQFSIESYTCTLLPRSKKDKQAILDSKTKYIIPIYQRPYSWTEKELEPFINDIFKGFWGIEKNTENQEPMFIGTMQLSEKKFINENEYEQYIIDGQQRLSTFWVLLKTLNILFPDNEKIEENLKKIQFETEVGEEQQKYLAQLFNLLKITDNEDEQNPYLRNASIIKNLFNQNIENNNDNFPIDEFSDYLTTQIYFVVIETYAGLSKTIQIFNAINTTGLDLNGGDIFKIRMYEYLTSEKHEESTDAFKGIEKLYNIVDEKNKDLGYTVTNIRGILEIYQDYLISKYGLSNTLFDYGVDSFFEKLFDSLLGINQSEQFKNLKEEKVELKLKELTDFIKVRYEWAKEWDKDWNEIEYSENIFLSEFIWRTRYGKYWKVIFILLYHQRDLSYSERYNNCQKLLMSLNKLFFIYSIRYDKAINEIHTFMRNLQKQILSISFEKVITSIEEKISSANNEIEMKKVLSNNIAYNAKKKNLSCLLSAYLDELDEKGNAINISELYKKLFETTFDIEHIHANGDITLLIEEDSLQNGVGNLVMLESGINRAIKDKPFEKKKIEYKNSIYSSIKKIAPKEKWTEKEIIERRDNEVQKILKYLYS